ncbi:MAG: LAGLIDADG family homing endonuclease [Patescibacteria group bacterium]
MGKRGPKAKELIKTTWSPNLAYAIGLLATDGCLARNTTLIDLTSKDREQLENFNLCLGLKLKIGTKISGYGKRGLRVQIKNRIFYDFLISIGLTPAKSKTLGEIKIPNQYFYDFLRGCFDGDGCFYSYWDPRWKSSFMFYTEFCSASPKFITWIQRKNHEILSINGHITKDNRGITQQLKYAKNESLKLLKKMYSSPNVICLSRKRLKMSKIFDSIGLSVKHITRST